PIPVHNKTHPSPCGRAPASSQSPKRLVSMPPTLMQEHRDEVYRDRSLWRLRCTNVVDDSRGLACRDRPSSDCKPFWLVGLRLASLPVRVRRLLDRALVDGPYSRRISFHVGYRDEIEARKKVGRSRPCLALYARANCPRHSRAAVAGLWRRDGATQAYRS